MERRSKQVASNKAHGVRKESNVQLLFFAPARQPAELGSLELGFLAWMSAVMPFAFFSWEPRVPATHSSIWQLFAIPSFR
jgi:hypothetical protein